MFVLRKSKFVVQWKYEEFQTRNEVNRAMKRNKLFETIIREGRDEG